MNKLKKKLIKTCIMIFALVSVTIGVAFSWFSGNSVLDTGTTSINIITSNDLQVSEDGVNWKYNAELKSNSVEFSPITTNCTTFYKPVYTTSTDSDNVTKKVMSGYEEMTDDELKEVAVVKTFSIKSLYRVKLYIDSASYVSPARPSTDEELEAGIYSNDYIAGAIRVVIQLKVDDAWKPIGYWIPNTTYELSTDDDGNYVFTTNGSFEDKIYFLDSSGNETYTFASKADCVSVPYGIRTICGVIPEEYTSTYALTTLEAGISQFRIIVYADGFDREISPIFSDGYIEACIRFHTELTK